MTRLTDPANTERIELARQARQRWRDTEESAPIGSRRRAAAACLRDAWAKVLEGLLEVEGAFAAWSTTDER